MLLLAHYGDEFKGFCVKYNLQLLKQSLVEFNSEVEFAWAAVNYVNKAHTIDLLDEIGNSTLQYFKSIQCKYGQWSYECEVRLIATKLRLMSFAGTAITDIYIGEKIPKEQRALLSGVVEHNLPHTKVHMVVANRDDYFIDIRETPKWKR
ncbi:Protein of unknown function (DUF2971) [Shewanella psychrophila]|uniref:Uncharacterized protein n=1 Tax=Shewanella psychrophila TaxID=225848 RepID=A0A1S6HY79_9GAMM|nr:DUF2971 domain-containing protein [Shewanella psychrophila]AQS40388.1 Protein of unknown function (DUF2971) [Shewanella psychrophila]